MYQELYTRLFSDVPVALAVVVHAKTFLEYFYFFADIFAFKSMQAHLVRRNKRRQFSILRTGCPYKHKENFRIEFGGQYLQIRSYYF